MERLSPDEGTSGPANYPVPVRGHADAPRPAPARYGSEDFPGCESFRLPASEIAHYEGRLEFWDGNTETAWKVCEPTSIQHEGPSRRLVEMATRVASVRGSRIVCFGSADLVRLDATGRKRWLMQADEVLYLRAERSRLSGCSCLGRQLCARSGWYRDLSTEEPEDGNRRWLRDRWSGCYASVVHVVQPEDHPRSAESLPGIAQSWLRRSAPLWSGRPW